MLQAHSLQPTPQGSIPGAGDGMNQSDQGRQYGQPGFVGEPINLNVVNADIRDILNYITEQYSVNFVIDSSVGAVPVTVNVQDVPWNIALDAVLKANRLGVEVSGNILRVATTEVLATESSTQKVLTNARLDASPLVTEFIRLNYACAFDSHLSGPGLEVSRAALLLFRPRSRRLSAAIQPATQNVCYAAVEEFSLSSRSVSRGAVAWK